MSTAVPQEVRRAGIPAGRRERRLWNTTEFTVFAVVVVLSVALAAVRPQFLAPQNIQNLMFQIAGIAIPAMGMTLVIITGGFDVSIGSLMGVAAVLMGKAALAGMHPLAVVAIGVGTGTLLGAFNGVLIAHARIPPVITTLGTLNLLRALVFTLLGGKWISGIPFAVRQLTLGRFAGVPYPAWVTAALVAFMAYVLARRPFGRHVYAVGGNPEAAVVAGIPVKQRLMAVYVITGALVGLAGFIFIGRGGLVQTNAGTGLELQVIAATVLGGTSVMGGKGSVIGSLLGATLVTVLRNSLILLNIPALWEGAIIGGLLVAAVILDLYRRGRATW